MSLRIRVARETGGRRAGEAGGYDFYLDRLVKLIPAEAITAYPFLHSRAVEVADQVAKTPVPANGMIQSAAWLPVGVAWLLLIIVILIRWQSTRVPGQGAQWGTVIIAAISFLLWVPVLDGIAAPGAADVPSAFGIFDTLTGWQVLAWPDEVKKFVPELLLVLWTMIIPHFYQPAD